MTSHLAKLSNVLGRNRAVVELNWIRRAAQSQQELQLMISRRARGEPLQYVLGTQPFGPLNLLVRRPILIPRPETEQWTTELAKMIQAWPPSNRRLRMLDLCTGSGCIPLLLCHLLNLKKTTSPLLMDVLGIDVSLSACQLACENIVSSGSPFGCSLDVRQKNIFDEDFPEFLQKSFKELRARRHTPSDDAVQLDIVTANPPYIPTDKWRSLSPDVKEWEDPLALLGDPPGTPHSGGLTFYKRIRELISDEILSPHFVLAMEVGEGQAAEVVEIFRTRFGAVEVWKDWWGKERAVFINGN